MKTLTKQKAIIAHAHALDCVCGAQRNVGYDACSKTWVFWCKECKAWYWLPKASISKLTVMEWIRQRALKAMSNIDEGFLEL